MNEEILKFWKYSPIKKPIYKGKFCSVPFRTLSIDEDGDVQLCGCTLHMPYTIGNIYEHSLETIWLNSKATDVRQSVIEGDFTYCNWACSKLAYLKSNFTIPKLKNFPSEIKIDMDRSCNLKCPSCRENIIIEKHATKIDRQVKIFDEVKIWALNNPDTTITVIPVGNGEIFASHSGLAFLQSLENYPFNNLKLHITSNGTLIKKNQDLIFKLKDIITDWSVSIDAATPETYAKVRGGNWENLLDGLDIIHRMGITPLFKFCIQKDNYHEIEQFAEFADRFNATINYQKLLDWGHWTIAWWHDNNVFDRTRDSFTEALSSLDQVKEKYGSRISMAAELSKYLEKFKESP